ncbi:MAG TPA: hypothetical protein VM370_06225 [Candidatus Thermoplasmatota archaeon]|nr:hypothetical protein [Candidatus Thermoplasmatota archaeon]
MRTLLALLTLSLLTLPLAFAQEDNSTRPPDGSADPSSPSQAAGDDAAWVDDCPPDMMCAAGANDTDEHPDGRPDVCDADVDCAGGTNPYGSPDCIECTGGPVDAGSDCMDGADDNETCRDDVYYLGGEPEPARGPADGSCENCRGDVVEPETAGAASDAAAEKSVPAPAVALVILAGAAALVLSARRG